jgi:hypothetical protein
LRLAKSRPLFVFYEKNAVFTLTAAAKEAAWKKKPDALQYQRCIRPPETFLTAAFIHNMFKVSIVQQMCDRKKK